ncbi:MAG: HlyD family efflux transporter periplasmic adaptor subunit [Deltaproteobacteria bacterium]|nr:HlyD family efflux transporter periplasmic adaptor subunit [Deltaproteobacteria bacterium]
MDNDGFLRFGRAAVGLLLVLALTANGCETPSRDLFQGYVEAEYTYVSSPQPGELTNLFVRRGENVAAGTVLFELEREPEIAQRNEAEQRLQQSKKRLEDLRKGMRPTEIDAIKAKMEQARASLRLSELEYERRRKLFADRTISKENLDQAQTKYHSDRALVDELSAQLETARLGAREDIIRAAESEVAAMEATLAQVDWRLEQKTQLASEPALVFDTYYTVGEWVSAGRPVVALLIRRNIKVRFFVPEPLISGIKLNQTISIGCDGCPEGLRGHISYISPQAEYTPPVIYSRHTRSKLVFMVEVLPDREQERLHPGQPVDVTLIEDGENT